MSAVIFAWHGNLIRLVYFHPVTIRTLPGIACDTATAFSPAHIEWSVEARGYSAMIFFTLLSSYLFFKLLQQPSRNEGILFIATSVFAIYVHLYAIFVTGIQFLYLLYLTTVHTEGTSFASFDKTSIRSFRNYFLAIGGLVLMLYIPVA